MAAGACLARRTGGRTGSQVAASGLGVFLEHTAPVALQAWLAEHLSAMSGPAGRADPPSSRPAKPTSCTSGRPSGICWLISQSDSMISSCAFQTGASALVVLSSHFNIRRLSFFDLHSVVHVDKNGFLWHGDTDTNTDSRVLSSQC